MVVIYILSMGSLCCAQSAPTLGLAGGLPALGMSAAHPRPNAGSNPGAVLICQWGSPLTTASNSGVHVINGGSDTNVFWQVGSSATLGTGTSFTGNILALASITLTTGASVSGRAFA